MIPRADPKAGFRAPPVSPASLPPSAFRFRVGEREYDLTLRSLVVGVVNLTPDSFSDGGRWLDPEAALAHALALVEEGADVIDVGGESTRPGAAPVSAEEELARVRPLLERLCPRAGVPVSIDTSKPLVAEAALDLGVRVVNDVTGLRDTDLRGLPVLAGLAQRYGASLFVMHMQGDPDTMQQDPHYEDVVHDVGEFLGYAAVRAQAAGVAHERIALDPGIGFGKTLDHNLELLRRVDNLAMRGYPVMVGVSRKSLFQKLLDLPVDQRLEAGLAAAVVAVSRGARLVRTHDVRATVRALRMAEALL
jgi:dihydropteroate synthase